MDVELFVYDLSQGAARQLSRALTGVQIDAIYHTSIVIGGVEYYFGAGIQMSEPGKTHHGRPIEIVKMGTTQLPAELISDYLESLQATYSTESYDLFLRNCNHFSSDFAFFLVNKKIPAHITDLPQTVLNTPFGQMMKPRLDAAMRQVTQAPTINAGVKQGPARASPLDLAAPSILYPRVGVVNQVDTLESLETLLSTATTKCAVIFFTSASCAPCRLAYSTYDELAEEAGERAVLLKVDIDAAYEIAQQYAVTATPTFTTILKGSVLETWQGIDNRALTRNVRLLIRLAYPPHPHLQNRLPVPNNSWNPLFYKKIPPLQKLSAKVIGNIGSEEHDKTVSVVKDYIAARFSNEQSPMQDYEVPDRIKFREVLLDAGETVPPTLKFAIVDLFRCFLIDRQNAEYFVDEPNQLTLSGLLDYAKALPLEEWTSPLRLVTLQTLCNCFASPASRKHFLTSDYLCSASIEFIRISLCDMAPVQNVRAVAETLAYNLAASNCKIRCDEEAAEMTASDQLALVAALLEALQDDLPLEDTKRIVLSLSHLVYLAPLSSEIWAFLEVMGTRKIIQLKASEYEGEATFKDALQLLDIQTPET